MYNIFMAGIYTVPHLVLRLLSSFAKCDGYGGPWRPPRLRLSIILGS